MSGTSSPLWELLKRIITASNNRNYDEMCMGYKKISNTASQSLSNVLAMF